MSGRIRGKEGGWEMREGIRTRECQQHTAVSPHPPQSSALSDQL